MVPETGAHATCYAPRGLAATADHLATSTAVSLLRAGGSAADAAIGANAVLGVIAPHLCGMGGDLFALVHHGVGTPAALVAAGHAGSGVDADQLRAEGHRTMPFRGDLRSAPVPGCVDGWLALHERFGRLELGAVLAPARRLAGDGFPAGAMLAALVPLLDGVAGAEDLVAVAHRPGATCRRPGLAAAIAAVADEGRDGFYDGAFGRGLVRLGHGTYTAEDLRRPIAEWVPPLGRRVWGHDVWTMPPPSQGYLVVLAAAVAEQVGLPAEPEAGDWGATLVAAALATGHDRIDRLADGRDGAELVADAEVVARAELVRTGRLPTRAPVVDGDTTYLAVADGDGMAVSLIQSNAADFGAYVFEPTTGIGLQNRGVGFSLQPGHPAEAAARRRPPSTLSPGLVTRPDGTLAALVGVMGGDAQPHLVLQLLAGLLLAGDPPGRVLRRPRFALERPGQRGFDLWDDPAEVQVAIEADAPAAWAASLRERGQAVREVPPLDHAVGHAQVVVPVPGGWGGAADPRSGVGTASGW